MPAVTVENHPQKAKILKKIMDGLSVRAVCVGLEPPLSFSAIQRYKTNVVKPMLLRAGESGRILNADLTTQRATQPLSTDTVAVQAVTTAVKDAPMLSIFRQRLEALHGRIDRTLTKAEDAVRVVTDPDTGELVVVGADLSIIAPLVNQAHKNLDMLGRATGELEQSGPGGGVSIQVVCPVAPAIDAMPRINYASDDAIEALPPVEEFAEIGVKNETA